LAAAEELGNAGVEHGIMAAEELPYRILSCFLRTKGAQKTRA